MVECEIPGVVIRSLKSFADERGWLSELFRDDELPVDFQPAMGYVSATKPGIARGPHEHREQTDGFAFLFGEMRLYLWENRPSYPDSSCFLNVGEVNPMFVIVPPGVVHAYKNVGSADVLVLNFPNALYAGKGRAEPVDEIRHESDENSRFRVDQ